MEVMGMDPNATLKEMRELVRRAEERERENRSLEPDDSDRLVELVEAMDGWLSRGGFLPAAWAAGRP